MLNNIIARIRPRTIIFSKVDQKIIDQFKEHLKLPEGRYLYINNKDQLNLFLRTFKSSTNGSLKCPPSRIKVTYALLEAKRRNLQLVIDSKSTYKINKNQSSKHIIVSDTLVNVLPCLLANYAFSIDADIRVSKVDLKYEPQEIISILDGSRIKDKRGRAAREITKSIVAEIQSKLSFLKIYDFVSFFIDDFPYGYFFPDKPSTHIYNKSLPSHFLAKSISAKGIHLQSALLVDTGFFENSETEIINLQLQRKNVVTKVLEGNKFTNLELSKNVQFLPYDFLSICSHGGFPEGVRFKVKFKDKNCCDHVIVIDTIDSFFPTNRGEGDNRIIDVQTFYEFVELDGKPWFEKEYKPGSSKTLVEDFLAIGRDHWQVVEKQKVFMRHCNVIETQDKLGPYVPMIHSISDVFSTPFIFNNSCSSTYTLSSNFLFAGSIAYIGTVNSVGTISAVKVAEMFAQKAICEEKPIALSLWESVSELNIVPKYRVYVCFGCHFNKFFFSITDNKLNLKKRIRIEAYMRKQRINDQNMEDSVKIRHSEAIDFLFDEYQRI
ncbi:hypothetical protein M1116_01950 [Patescibacteria group bacterium]|nr:hypothetical protein [Patescibacteria group bacterium]